MQNPEMKNVNRLAWLDLAKGFAMLLVLIGHCMRDEMRQVSPVLDFLYRAFYIFHMSYFFWLSGVSYRLSRDKGRPPLQIAARRLKKQFPPWMIYTLFIFAVFSLAISIPALRNILEPAGYSAMSFPDYLLAAFQANNPWAYHLWFLYVLMLLMILLCLADAATSGRHTTVVCAGLTMLGLAALAVQSLLSLGEWWRLFNYLALYLPMVCLGVLMAKWQLPDGIVWAWGVAGLAYIAVRVMFFSGFSGNSLRIDDPAGRFLIYLLADLLLPGVMMALNRLFDRGWLIRTRVGKRAFRFLGRESMIIYLVHQPFCCAFLGLILYERLRLPALPVMAVCMVASIAVSWVVSALLNRIKVRFSKTKAVA